MSELEEVRYSVRLDSLSVKAGFPRRMLMRSTILGVQVSGKEWEGVTWWFDDAFNLKFIVYPSSGITVVVGADEATMTAVLHGSDYRVLSHPLPLLL